jgi:hypothetical protein
MPSTKNCFPKGPQWVRPNLQIATNEYMKDDDNGVSASGVMHKP